jgi:hypothetical protein
MRRTILRLGVLVVCVTAVALLGLGYHDGALGGPPTDREAAAAALGHMLSSAKNPAELVACVSLDDPYHPVDFPRGFIDDLMSTYPGLHAGSACEYDAERHAYYLKQGMKRVTMIVCGTRLRRGAPPAEPGVVRVECALFHGGLLNAEGVGFDVRRSLLGTMSVEDLGIAWVS